MSRNVLTKSNGESVSVMRIDKFFIVLKSLDEKGVSRSFKTFFFRKVLINPEAKFRCLEKS